MNYVSMKITTKSKICPTEFQEAVLLMDLIKTHPSSRVRNILNDHLIHIPMGGSRNIVEAKNLKRQGAKAGVSDYFLAYPTGVNCGLWIELKRSKRSRSKLSKAQSKWLELMISVGYNAAIAYGASEAMEILEHYLLDITS
jgi:hypothetical protein